MNDTKKMAILQKKKRELNLPKPTASQRRAYLGLAPKPAPKPAKKTNR